MRPPACRVRAQAPASLMRGEESAAAEVQEAYRVRDAITVRMGLQEQQVERLHALVRRPPPAARAATGPDPSARRPNIAPAPLTLHP